MGKNQINAFLNYNSYLMPVIECVIGRRPNIGSIFSFFCINGQIISELLFILLKDFLTAVLQFPDRFLE